MTKKLSPVLLSRLGFILILLLGYIFLIYIPDKELDKNHRYTIGIIRQFEMPSNGDELAKFYFQVKGREYYNFCAIMPGYEGKFKIGSRIFVKFSPQNPDRARVINEKVVSDSLVAPGNGWVTLPN